MKQRKHTQNSRNRLATSNPNDMVRLAMYACSRTCLQLGQAQPWTAGDMGGRGEDGTACSLRRGPRGEARLHRH
eukprot:1158470-Pelagomonas_calceolata.AAC.10